MSTLYEQLKSKIQEREKKEKQEPTKEPEISSSPMESRQAANVETVEDKPIEQPGPETFNPVCELCKAQGLSTHYSDPVVMRRHMQRVHHVGIQNLNQPKPHDLNSTGDPVLEGNRHKGLSVPSDWGRRMRW